MVRPLTFRVCTAVAAFVFAAMGGLTGVEAHPLSQHGPHSAAIIAMEIGAVSQTPGGSHAAHNGGHSRHGSSNDCTCVGVCQGGGSSTLSEPPASQISLGAIDRDRVAWVAVPLIHQDPTSYLLPLPNAPPVRV